MLPSTAPEQGKVRAVGGREGDAHMLKINVQTIDHDEQRYPTSGDYWEDDDGTLQVRISEVGDRRYEFLVAMHELIEFELCRLRGIAEPVITAFDVQFEKEIEEGLRDLDEQPGDDPSAPYHREHVFATKLERMLAEEMGVDWDEYDDRLGELFE
jgi:hypothetical protein